jgi:hypothetical protein
VSNEPSWRSRSPSRISRPTIPHIWLASLARVCGRFLVVGPRFLL